jgi:acyl-CoA reductase-like NAD-dependent aldehyde dehydrogenase
MSYLGEGTVSSGKFQYSINPATEETLASFRVHTREQVSACLEKAEEAHSHWSRESFSFRGGLVKQAAAYLRRHKNRFAEMMSSEMGKPITESEAEVEKCAWNLEYYADNAESHLKTVTRASNARESYTQCVSLGVVLAVMPWNYPFWQVFRFAAPALMAGNTAILKHASNVPQCALAIEEVFREAGLPEGSFQTLLVPSSEVAEIIENPIVSAVTLTGSERAGSAVASQAGRALKKTVLELGGSDPFIVLGDADMDLAVKAGITARYQNTGQSCIAAKRFIIVASVFEEYLERFVDEVAKLKVGDPGNRDTRIGPLARPEFVDEIMRQVEGSVAMGAEIVTGGEPVPGKGYFYQPTVLTAVRPEMPAGREELFGPVAAMMRASNTEEAILLANRTSFGLGSSVWTSDVESAKRWAARLEAGQVFINGIVASDPRLPFGGIKKSGYGRELSELGIREFVNIQTVWVG